MIRTAADLLRVKGARPLPASPRSFDGPLSELLQDYVEPTLPPVEEVAAFHEALLAYIASPDPLFLIRYMKGVERGNIYTVADGTRFKGTDNAPAWWTQAAVFRGARISAVH